MEKELLSIFRINEHEITTQKIRIEENLLRFDNFTLQLSNISQLYAGEKKFQIPKGVILFFLGSLIVSTIFPKTGLVGTLISFGYVYLLFQDYTKQRLYLSFSLNSGKFYELRFSEERFLTAVRDEVEAAFNAKNTHAVINIAEQKIVNGDHHEVYGDHANVNSGLQMDNIIHSHNEDSYHSTDASFTMGDIQNSSIHSAAFGSENVVTTVATLSSEQWTQLQQDLHTALASLKNDSTIKMAVAAALAAAQQQDQTMFEKTVKHYRKEFMSGLFKDVASGLLVQVVASILGLS